MEGFLRKILWRKLLASDRIVLLWIFLRKTQLLKSKNLESNLGTNFKGTYIKSLVGAPRRWDRRLWRWRQGVWLPGIFQNVIKLHPPRLSRLFHLFFRFFFNITIPKFLKKNSHKSPKNPRRKPHRPCRRERWNDSLGDWQTCAKHSWENRREALVLGPSNPLKIAQPRVFPWAARARSPSHSDLENFNDFVNPNNPYRSSCIKNFVSRLCRALNWKRPSFWQKKSSCDSFSQKPEF